MATSTTQLVMDEIKFTEYRDRPQTIDHEMWSALYTSYHRTVLQICRRFFKQPQDAEDAAAEVFLKLHKILHLRNEAQPFRPWLLQVARHHCIDKLRRRKCEKSSSLNEIGCFGVADASAPSPLLLVLRREEQHRIREQLTRLPMKYRVPLVLRYYKQMSYSEIADKMNRGIAEVRVKIFRAKGQLRSKLRQVGLTHSETGSTTWRTLT
jgi:RNA polymerase sigma-70 factor (ECF subfamily)